MQNRVKVVICGKTYTRAQITGFVEEAAAARIETAQLRREVSLLKRENENLKSNLELYELRDKVGDNQK